MRLTHLKLAGFKSFSDTTTLHIHGQRVAVVGPNGCGKSNVMESVRWVMGESSAKELRGDNMDAVIFNGSGNRKPISRASVELIFDNSMGSAAGEWSQYAEISVKRVIEREKGSTYYINNSVVRKRDVADLFLGTGLGGRGYAIIGQNTINRLVEAKPEEMRVFLEEAAGISKYKERRRETELRLRDTTENLTRVDDVLRELAKQIERLETQAEVAADYTSKQTLLSKTEGQIWLLKKHEAHDNWQASQRLVEQLVNDLEAQVASLRHNENELETARQLHIDATDAMNVAQTQFYEANAEVSGLEGQIKSAEDESARMKLQLQQVAEQTERNSSQQEDLQISLEEAIAEQERLIEAFAEAEAAIESAKSELEDKSQRYQNVLETYNASLQTLNNAEQTLRIEQTSVQHLQRSSNEMQTQLTRLTQQLAQIQMPDDLEVATLEAQLEEAQAEQVRLETDVHDMQQKEQQLIHVLRDQREAQQASQKQLHTMEAEIASLNKLQQSIRAGNKEGDLNAWLTASDLDGKPRLWQSIRMHPGWETALEAALSGRLNAIVNDTIAHDSRPPNALTVIKTNGQAKAFDAGSHAATGDKVSIFTQVDTIDENITSVLESWLKDVYIAEDTQAAIALAESLTDDELVVTKAGDIYTTNSVSYFGPQSQLHGVLERQAELDRLNSALPAISASVESAQASLDTSENALASVREAMRNASQTLKAATSESHALSLKAQQLKQQQQNANNRKLSLEQELATATEKRNIIAEDLVTQESKIGDAGNEINAFREQKQLAEAEKNSAQAVRNDASNLVHALEQDYQEQSFNIKLTDKSIEDLNDKLSYLKEEADNLASREHDLSDALTTTNAAELLVELELLLEKKQTFEHALNEARNVHSEREMALQDLERDRMKNEQMLHPLRDKLEASRLKDQEMRLYYEQCVEELADSEVPEAELAEDLDQLNAGRRDKPHTVKELAHKRDKLLRQIEHLGAVNLAAIDELKAESTRHNLLTQQRDDLTEASETLEAAIKKIDKETRGRLQATYEEANQHFKSLFSTLFNGGQARLELLGDEILDTGVQVFAQPPGKKNSTIHLLSGGEKAMTAIALVFALFRLNPAPFCLMDEVDAPLDDSNTERFCAMVKKMSEKTQFLYVSHNKITMEMAQQMIGVTMQESGVSRIVDVDMEAAIQMVEAST